MDAKYTSDNLPSFTDSKDSLLENYLAGLIDTDGGVYKKRIQLKLKNKIIIQKIYECLIEMEMNANPPKINYTNSVPFYYIRFDNKLPLRLK